MWRRDAVVLGKSKVLLETCVCVYYRGAWLPSHRLGFRVGMSYRKKKIVDPVEEPVNYSQNTHNAVPFVLLSKLSKQLT